MFTTKCHRVFLCACGVVSGKRIVDVLGGQVECATCARRRSATAYASTPKGKANLLRAASIRAKQNTVPPEWRRLVQICQCAKGRCTNAKDKAYKNYGGRGIRFDFGTGADMAKYVRDTLGPRPAKTEIDRIDNDGHYAAGNLRWATKKEQAGNKRPYYGARYGHRIQRLLASRSGDVGYETIRTWINRGLSDEEILSRKRSTSGRPRLRHS